MTNLIPTAGFEAVFSRSKPDGQTYAFTKPVIAWDEHGNAYVHDRRWGGVRSASDVAGYKGTQEADLPVVAALPAAGWRAEYADNDGTKATEPVIAWLIRADGSVDPVSMGIDGSGYDPSGVDNFVRLVGPGETS